MNNRNKIHNGTEFGTVLAKYQDKAEEVPELREARMPMKIVLTQRLDEAAMDLLKDSGAEVYTAESADFSQFMDAMEEADSVIIRVGQLTAEIMDRCPKLRVIGLTGVGYDRVDVGHASEKGIPVVYTPGANSLSVAEHTVALMFAAAKNITESDRELRKGSWKVRDAGKAFELSGKTVGIIGVGAIGAHVARICQGIGMHTIAYSHSGNRKKVEAAGCEYCETMEELLRRSDFVTIHNPLTPETMNMITARELGLMKRTAILINTSRGPIVNEPDLREALEQGVIAGAGIDVFAEEPALPDNPVFQAPNTVVTPHLAALTREAKSRMHVNAVKGVLALLSGETWQDVVDKNVCSIKAQTKTQKGES